jgi:hypothetical protein
MKDSYSEAERGFSCRLMNSLPKTGWPYARSTTLTGAQLPLIKLVEISPFITLTLVDR